jgi:uncharacterized membrane protein
LTEQLSAIAACHHNESKVFKENIMKTTNLAITAAVTGLIALGSTLISAPAVAAEKEKCYGVAKAGKNDCATKTSSCAGTAKQDNQTDAFVVVPKGLCGKLAGGSTVSS